MELGNLSDARHLGGGVWERRIHWGPGYRIYFGREGEQTVILLAGGSKRHQSRDIVRARDFWQDYRHRRKKERRAWH